MMAYYMSEKQALKKLGISDWQHMTRDKIIKFSKVLYRMDPDVAKAALAQFPQFTKLSSELIDQYKSVIDKVLDSNVKGAQEYYNLCNNIIISLNKELEREDLLFEQRQWIIEKMVELSRDVALKNKEDKTFWIKLIGGLATILGLLGVIIRVLLNNQTDSDLPDDDSLYIDSSDEDEDE